MTSERHSPSQPLPRWDLYTLALVMLVAFLLRAWNAGFMAIEHFDEGVYASNLFSDHIGFRYPDQHLYAPPLLPTVLEWTLILTGANPASVMWVNVVFGTLLVWAVWWTTRELILGGDVVSAFQRSNSPDKEDKQFIAESKLLCRNTETHRFLTLQSSAAGLVAAILMATNELMIQYSRAALTDIPLCLGITLAVGCGVRGLRTGSWWFLSLCSLATAFAWWTKYNGWLPLAILGAGSAGWLLLDQMLFPKLLPLLRRNTTSETAPVDPHSPSTASARHQRKASKKKNQSQSDSLQQKGLKLAGYWLLIATGAFLLWSPVLSGLQQYGGYEAVASNHAGYVVGLNGWWDSLLKHLAVDHHYTIMVSIAGLAAATFLSILGFPDPSFRWEVVKTYTKDWYLHIASIVALLIATEFRMMLPILVLFAIAGVLGRPLRYGLFSSEIFPRIGQWILAAWLIGLGLTTPLYTPYPRLILPLLTGLIIATGMGMILIRTLLVTDEDETTEAEQREILPAEPGRGVIFKSRMKDFYLVLVFICLPLVFPVVMTGSSEIKEGVSMEYSYAGPAWQERNNLQHAAANIKQAIEEDLQQQNSSPIDGVHYIVYTLAEPGLYYHLAASEGGNIDYITQPAPGLKILETPPVKLDIPVYVVTGPHSRNEAEELTKLPSKIEHLENFTIRPSDLVLLDELLPSQVKDHLGQSLSLWRILP